MVNHLTIEARENGKKAGSVRPVRLAAFFCLDFSLPAEMNSRQAGLLLSFDQAKEIGIEAVTFCDVVILEKSNTIL